MRFKRGTTREVILVGRFALKFASFRSWELFLTGMLCNLRENERAGWPGWSGKVPRPYLSLGGVLLVVERAEDGGEYDGRMAALREELSFIPEAKRSSFGIIGARLVAVDYGD